MSVPLPVWKGASYLILQPNTGTFTLAERTSDTDVYRGTYDACLAGAVPRGTFGVGARAGWVVTNSVASRVSDLKRNIGELTINWEAGGASATMPLPCDDFELEPVENYLRIERHPYFSGITPATAGLAYQSVQGNNELERNNTESLLAALSDLTQRNLGQKLLAKLRNGEETFYTSYLRYSWTSFSYTMPTINLGGSISSPGGPLASDLSSVGSALRIADRVSPVGVNGSSYKIIRTWLVGFSGQWDPDLYP